MARLRYFDGVRTLSEAKRRYRLLAKELHPDSASGRGNKKWFQELVEEYAEVQQRLRRSSNPEPIETSTESSGVETMPKVMKPVEGDRAKQTNLHKAIDNLALAAGSVLAIWLKGFFNSK